MLTVNSFSFLVITATPLLVGDQQEKGMLYSYGDIKSPNCMNHLENLDTEVKKENVIKDEWEKKDYSAYLISLPHVISGFTH